SPSWLTRQRNDRRPVIRRRRSWGGGESDANLVGLEKAAQVVGLPVDELADAGSQSPERLDRHAEPRPLGGVTPHARDAAVDEEHRREPTLRPVHPLVMRRLDEMPVVLLAKEERVEKREQTHDGPRSEEHTSELQSRFDLVCRLLLEKK